MAKTAQTLQYCSAGQGCLIPLVYNLSYRWGFRAGITPESVRGDLVKTIDMDRAAAHLGIVGDYKNFNDTFDVFYRTMDFDKISEHTYDWEQWETKAPAPQQVHRVHLTLYNDLVRAYVFREVPKLLQTLNKIFDYLVPVAAPSADAEKLAYLEEWCATAPKYPEEHVLSNYQRGPVTPPVYELLEPFLYEFNYHKLLADNFPTLRQVAQPGQAAKIYDTHHGITTLKLISPPKLGDLAPLLFKSSDAGQQLGYTVRPDPPIYNWYENTLRQIFKELGLTYKRTGIQSAKPRPTKYRCAYGWEITTPPEELAARQIICL